MLISFIYNQQDFKSTHYLDYIISHMTIGKTYKQDLYFGGKKLANAESFNNYSTARPLSFIIGQKSFIDTIGKVKFSKEDTGIYLLNIEDFSSKESFTQEINQIVELNKKDQELELKRFNILSSRGFKDFPTFSMWVDTSGSISSKEFKDFTEIINELNKK